jgi:RNA polymerase sigma-70 factor (ECF subfamily)
VSETATEPVEKPLDSDVIATLVGNHRRFLAFLERRVESKEAAEDILQAALAKAVEKGGEIRDSESAVAWFFRLLRNAVIDHYRRRAARERMLESEAKRADEEAVSDEDLHRAVCACFEELIPTLKPDYAAIVQAVDLKSQPVAEVAKELGITANNASVRLHRARQALKLRLEQTCATCAEHGCLDCTCETSVGHGHGRHGHHH